MPQKRVRTKQKWITVAILATVIFLLYIYGSFDPTDAEIGKYFPKCPVKLLTGLQCPGCGIQRAIHELLHGDLIGALSQNWFLVFSLSYLLALFITQFLPEGSPARKFFWGETGGMIYVSLYCAWFIIRNLLGV